MSDKTKLILLILAVALIVPIGVVSVQENTGSANNTETTLDKDLIKKESTVMAYDLESAEQIMLDVMGNRNNTDTVLTGLFENTSINILGVTAIGGIRTLYIAIDIEMEDEEYDQLLEDAKVIFGEMPWFIHRNEVTFDQSTNQIVQTKTPNIATSNDTTLNLDDDFFQRDPIVSATDVHQAEKKMLDILINGTSSDIGLNSLFEDVYVHGVGIAYPDDVNTLYISIDQEMEDEEYEELLDTAKRVFGEIRYSIQRESLVILDQSTTPDPTVISNELIVAEKKMLDILYKNPSSDPAVNALFDDIYVHGVGVSPIDGVNTLYIAVDPELEDEEYNQLLNDAKKVFGDLSHAIHRDSLLIFN